MKAFAPAHITGFFSICEDTDPMRTGSCGAGLSLDDGVFTEVSLSDTTRIFLNGKESKAVTTRKLIDLLTDRPVKVDSRMTIPVGGGLGASAAGAMSTALALNRLLGLEKSFNELCCAAHVAEVTNRTGLGDVAGMSCGGVEMRLKPGVPFVLDRIPVEPTYVYYVCFGPISTKSVLSDESEKRRINAAGSECLGSLLKKPTFEHLLALSKTFARDTGLLSKKATDAIEAVEAAGGQASMAMLGDTVFATTCEGLKDFGEVRRSKINVTGPRLQGQLISPDFFNTS